MAQPSSPQRAASAVVVRASDVARLNDAPSNFFERRLRESGAHVIDHVTVHSTVIVQPLVIVKSTVVSPESFCSNVAQSEIEPFARFASFALPLSAPAGDTTTSDTSATAQLTRRALLPERMQTSGAAARRAPSGARRSIRFPVGTTDLAAGFIFRRRV